MISEPYITLKTRRFKGSNISAHYTESEGLTYCIWFHAHKIEFKTILSAKRFLRFRSVVNFLLLDLKANYDFKININYYKL